jgi:hypothetical protein
MSLPRLPPRGNPTPATASTEMSYAQRQQARAALSALTPTAGQNLSEFTDLWIAAMRECGFDSREVAAAKAILVRLIDLGAEFPSAATAAEKPVAAITPTATPTPVETRRDPHAPVVIETELHPSDDDLDPDYSAHTAEPEPAPDPYDDEPDDDVIEPPHLTAPEPAVQSAPVPPAAAPCPPASQTSPPISSSRSRPYANIQPVQLPASSGPPRARNYKLPGT